MYDGHILNHLTATGHMCVNIASCILSYAANNAPKHFSPYVAFRTATYTTKKGFEKLLVLSTRHASFRDIILVKVLMISPT